MQTNRKTQWRRWVLALGAAAALGGGAAYAMEPECYKCIPCGCSPDGGNMMCCYAGNC